MPPVFRLTEAATDGHLVQLWLRTKRSAHTQRAYLRDATQFLQHAAVPLHEVRVEHLQAYSDDLYAREYADTTRARKLSAVKSLFTFAHTVGYLPFNAGAVLAQVSVRGRLAERILPEAQVQRILALETHPRNHPLLRLFYATGARVSELCALKVRDLQARTERRSGRPAGQITLFGKGGKTRAVLVSADTWATLLPLIEQASSDAPVFRSRKRRHAGQNTGGHLDPSQAWRIVRGAAQRAGIDHAVSPHWFRHAHASHALDRGAPAHLVRDTLGHGSLLTTNQYTHARPDQSSSEFLGT